MCVWTWYVCGMFDQGGGKRKGSIAAYIEPWHADIFAFLDLRKNHGNEMEVSYLMLLLFLPVF